jgi:hypothetical protein
MITVAIAITIAVAIAVASFGTLIGCILTISHKCYQSITKEYPYEHERI